MTKLIKEHAKAIAIFAFGVLYNLVMSLIRHELPWPTTWPQLAHLLITTFGAAIVTWLFPNRISDKQVANDPTVIRINPPVETAPAPTTGYWG